MLSQTSTSSIPANARIYRAHVEITTPYSVGGTISIGRTGSTSLMQATGDNDAQTASIYNVSQDTAFGGSALPVLVTVGGAPAAGAGVVVVEYCNPNS